MPARAKLKLLVPNEEHCELNVRKEYVDLEEVLEEFGAKNVFPLDDDETTYAIVEHEKEVPTHTIIGVIVPARNLVLPCEDN